MQRTTPDPPSLRTLLGREHLELEATFAALLAAVDADARVQATRLWAEFDARLRAHMELEEEVLLPAFEREHPREAENIRLEHQQIRKTLLELGVGMDLHLTRADVVERFIALLRAHAAGEDLQLYGWAQEHFALPPRSTVLDRMLVHLQHMPSA